MRTQQFTLLWLLIFCNVIIINAQDNLSQKNSEIRVADSLFNAGNKYLSSNLDSARLLFRKSWNIYSRKSDKLKTALSNKHIGITFAFENAFDSAANYMQKSLDIYTQLNDSLNQAFMFNNLGIIHTNNDKYHKGLKFLLKSLKLKEKLAYKIPAKKIDIASTQLNIGINFHNLYKTDKAKEYYLKGKNSYQLQNSKFGVAKAEMQLANLHYELKENKEAYKLYNDIIKSRVFEGNNYTLAKLYNNYGTLLMIMKLYSKSKEILNKAYELNIKIGNERSAIKNLNNYSDICYRVADYKQAIKVSQKSYKMAISNKSIRSQMVAAKTLAQSYKNTGDYKSASKYFEIHNSLKDSVYTVENNRTISELEKKYETEKKEQHIKALSTEKKLKEAELEHKSKINTISFIAIVFLVIVLVFAAVINRIIRKQKRLLNKQNNELKRLNDNMQKMFAIISHDLKNLISGFKGSGSLISFYNFRKDTEKLESLSEKLSVNSTRMESLLDNLLNWALAQDGFYSPVKEKINSHDIVNTQIDLVKDIASQKDVVIRNNIPSDLSIDFDKNNFSFIVRNILSNAIKFNKNGEVVFSAACENGNTSIFIEDDGVGMEDDVKNMLFTVNKGKSNKGTAGESGTGLGLKLVQDFINLNDAKINVESKPDEGTKFEIVVER